MDTQENVGNVVEKSGGMVKGLWNGSLGKICNKNFGMNFLVLVGIILILSAFAILSDGEFKQIIVLAFSSSLFVGFCFILLLAASIGSYFRLQNVGAAIKESWMTFICFIFIVGTYVKFKPDVLVNPQVAESKFAKVIPWVFDGFQSLAVFGNLDLALACSGFLTLCVLTEVVRRKSYA